MKRLLIVVLICLLARSGGALTWQEACQLAQKNSNELKSAAKQLESTDWSYKRSFSPILPQLSGNASLAEGSTATTGTAKSYSYGLTASQTLFQGLSNLYNIQSTYADLAYQKANYQASLASYFYDLRSAFSDVLVGQENITLLQQILKRRDDNARLIKLRYDSGKEDKGNMLGTKADAAKAGYDLAVANRDLKLAQLKLSQLLLNEVATVEEEVKVSEPARADFQQLLETTPSYVMAKYQLESADLAQKATISEFLPSLSLSGSYRKSGADWPPDASNKSWSLSLSYPFFPGGSNIADAAIYGARLAQAKEDYSTAVKATRYSLENAFSNFQNSIEQYQVNKQSLDAARERAMISRVKYLNGLTTFDEWNRIEDNYIQAQKSLLSYRRNVLVAEALWVKTYGGQIK